MVTWSNLLDGYNAARDITTIRPSLVSDFFGSNVLSTYYVQALQNFFTIIHFVFDAVVSSAWLIVLFFGLWYIIVTPVFRKFARWF